jgi:heptosyltransferase-1
LSEANQQRVLIVRLGAMGDILHALPAVTALRRAQPGLWIGWAVEPQWRALLVADSIDAGAASGTRSPAQPLVDRVHEVPAKQWGREPLRRGTLRSILAIRRELRDAHYDAAVDVQGALRSAVVARWARPQRLLGEAVPRESAARWLYRERIVTSGVHVIEQAMEVVQALGAFRLEAMLPMLPMDRVAAEWCTQQGVAAAGGPFVLLHAGAGWGAKRWPLERYAEVGAGLAARAGMEVLVHAAPLERELGRALAAALRARGVTPIVISPTVGQLIELTRRVALAVGGDTGPLHLAAALGKATVGIYGPTDPARNGPFHGRLSGESVVVRDSTSRRDHARHAAPEQGLLKIAPSAVVEAALGVLARQQQRLREEMHDGTRPGRDLQAKDAM